MRLRDLGRFPISLRVESLRGTLDCLDLDLYLDLLPCANRVALEPFVDLELFAEINLVLLLERFPTCII